MSHTSKSSCLWVKMLTKEPGWNRDSLRTVAKVGGYCVGTKTAAWLAGLISMDSPSQASRMAELQQQNSMAHTACWEGFSKEKCR